MRISFKHQYDTYQSDLSRTQSAFLEAQQRLSSGKSINSLSDDPAGAQFSVSARGLRSALAQYSKNLESADNTLKATEATLDDVQSLIRRAREIAVQGATATTTPEARQALANEVAQIQAKLVDFGNTQSGTGAYIFAGQRTDTKPFEVTNGTLTYHGDDADIPVEISPNETLISNQSGRVLIGDTWSQLDSLRQNLSSGSVADISNTNLPGLDQVQANVGQARGVIGARLQTVEEYTNHHNRRMDELTAQISNVEDVDVSEAILQMKQAETAYQAALQAVSFGQSLSLMDFLR